MNRSTGNRNLKNYMLLPVIAVLGFIPLIVHMHQYDAGMESYDWFPSVSNTRVDLFMAWKSYAIMILAGIMLLILAAQAMKKKKAFQMESAFYLLFYYAIFVLMSGLFSQYKPQVFTGSYEIFQPVGVILGYLIICYYTYNCVDSEEKVKRVLLISAIGLGIILVIGISQFIGYDLFQTTAGRFLISDAYHLDKLETITFNMPKHTVYATLYNPDFLSFYFGLLTPVVMAAFAAVKKPQYRILLGSAFIGCVLSLIGAGAAGGYLAFGIAVVAGIYILLSRNKKAFTAGIIVAAIAAVFGIILCVTTPVGASLERLFLGTQRSIDTRLIKSIETADGGVYFDLGNQTLYISYELNAENGQIEVNFTDAEGTQLPNEIVATDDGVAYELQDRTWGKCHVEPVVMEDAIAIRVNLDDLDWYFSKQADGTYYYYNPFGKWEKISAVNKSTLFRDDAMSGRGNIWNLTIPQLGKHIFIGSGANTFGFVYPQNDYVYKTYMGLSTVLVAKAHNWFLQEWIENGLIATLCLLGFYTWYFFRSLHIYRRCDLYTDVAKIGFGIFVGTIGYMVASVVSDSNVCTAPVFWVLMGLGMAVNRMIAEKEGLLVKTGFVEGKEKLLAKTSSGEDETKQPDSQAIQTSNVTKNKSSKKKSRGKRKSSK